jgi:hypothetical protein
MLVFKVLFASLVLVLVGLVLQTGDHLNIFYKNYLVKAIYQMARSNEEFGESPSCHGCRLVNPWDRMNSIGHRSSMCIRTGCLCTESHV